MKRFWIGLGVLCVMLALGILLNLWMGKLHSDLAQQLDRAGALAQEEQWEQAGQVARQAYARWQERRHLLAAVVDHEPLEEMERLFSQLWVYRQGHWVTEFAATCVQLARQAEAIGDSHILTWWNLL